MQRSAVFEQ